MNTYKMYHLNRIGEKFTTQAINEVEAKQNIMKDMFIPKNQESQLIVESIDNGITLMNKLSTHFLDNLNEEGINLSTYIEPLFLCRWNGIHSINGRSSHEIVEIHSKNTLLNKYQSTNLFDNDLNLQLDLNRWIDLTSQDNDFYNRPFINDNFEIERIK